ncbi:MULTISPECIES: hypothetical protein [unclassified Mesorhizobium]|uniref:hypothetical protein n=1 Tax=unclassified Mesorhizobium TaxID=325217 RepID=UPI0033389AB2
MKLRDLAEDLPGKWTDRGSSRGKSAAFAKWAGAKRELAEMRGFDEEHIHHPRRLRMDAGISHRHRRHDLHRLRPLFQSLLSRGHASLRRR